MTDEHIPTLLIPCQNKVTNIADAEDKFYDNIPKKSKSKIQHVCKICGREFKKKCGLTNHMLIHSGVKPFICEVCNKSFTKKCTLTVHQLTHSTERPHACDACDKSFARKTDLQKHKFVHTGEKRYVCEICDNKFTHQNNLRRHKFKHLPKEIEVTDAAGKNEDIQNSLHLSKSGRLQKSKSKMLRDSVDDKTFSETVQQESLKIEDQDPLNPLINVPQNINPGLFSMPNESVSVSKVDKKFNKKKDQNGANETEFSPKPLNRKNCRKPIYNRAVRKKPTSSNISKNMAHINRIVNLLVSNNVHIKNEDDIIKPDEVKEETEIKNSSSQEVGKDKSESTKKVSKHYTCEICNKSFAIEWALKSHLLTCTSDRPYVCNTCNKSYTRKAHLDKHRSVHTGEKPYTCEVCDSKFTHRHNLYRHRLKHCPKKVKGKKENSKNLPINENVQIVPSMSETLTQTFIKKDDQIPLHPLINAPNTINAVLLIMPNGSVGVGNFNKIFYNKEVNNDPKLTEIPLKPLNNENYSEPIYSVTNEENKTFETDSNYAANINSFENLRFTIIKNELDSVNPLINVSKQINTGLLVMPNQAVNVSKINDLVVDMKQHNEANEISLNDKSCTEPIYNIADGEEHSFGSDSNELANINSVINFMVENVDINNLDNLIESAEVKKEREIKDIYNSLPMSLDHDKIHQSTLDINPAIANPCPPQISIEKQIFNELEKLKKAQQSTRNYSKNKPALCGSEVLEKTVQNKDLCQSLSVYNDLEQALAFVSDVIKDAENDLQLPLLPNDKASQEKTGQCEIPKNITEEFQLQSIPPDVTEDTMNDVQLLINDDVQHNSSELNILGSIAKDDLDLHSLPDVSQATVPDVQLLSLMEDNIQSINNEQQVMLHIPENDQNSFHAGETFVEVLPIAVDEESKINSDVAPSILLAHDNAKNECINNKREASVKKDSFNTKDPFSCDICCEPFEDQKDFLLHVSSHISDDQKTCYLCDLDLDSNTLLRKHILTHYEDDDDISLDEDFSKIVPLAAGDFFLGDIDKIDLDDEDFEEKVARMYALAHVEMSMDGYDSDTDDDATIIYSYSQSEWSNKDKSSVGKASDQASINGLGLAEVTPDFNFNMLATSSNMKVGQGDNLENICSNSCKLDVTNHISNINTQIPKEFKLNSAKSCKLKRKCFTENSTVDAVADCKKVNDSKIVRLSNENLTFESTFTNNLSVNENKNERSNQIVMNIINKVDTFLKENFSDHDINNVFTSSNIQPSSLQTKSTDLDSNESSFSNVQPNFFQPKPSALNVDMNENSFSNFQPSSFQFKPADLNVNMNKSSFGNIQPISFQCRPTVLNVSIKENSCSNVQPCSFPSKPAELHININENSDNSIQHSILFQSNPDELDINTTKDSDSQPSPFLHELRNMDFNQNENSDSNIQPNSLQPKLVDLDINANENHDSNIKPSTFQTISVESDVDTNKISLKNIRPSSKRKLAVVDFSNINENSSNNTKNVEKKKPSFVCSFCDKTFTRKMYLHEHYLMHAGIKQYACEICDKKFTKKCALSIHSLIHTQERKYRCTDCSKTFSRKIDFQKHTMIHTGLKPYACDICQKAFNHQNNLRRHKRLHFNNKPFICYICSTGFSERIGLLSHVKIHIKEAEMKSADGKLSENIRNCLNSMKEKLYECSECKMLFARRDRLLKHKSTHTVKNPHQCEICGRGFQKKDQLKIHLSNHIRNEFQDINVLDGNLEDLELTSLEPTVQPTRKTHTCDQCFKVYSKSSALKCHYLTHTGERPHKCHLCCKAFAQRTNLKRHLLSHAGIKPFKCSICDKNFARKPYLRKHYLSHTSDELFTLLGNLPD